MPIFRLEPGEIAPWAGRYELVTHYGESTNFSVWCDEGARLPLVVSTTDELLWFVLKYETNEQAGVG
jgi:hypothetical protein